MKSEELRIGNFVNYFEDEHSEIRVIEYGFCHLDNASSVDYEHIKPIPLTEEWLPEKRETNVFWSNFSKDIGGYFLWISGYKVYIKHVHQLQNLYHSLTQTELKIK